MWIRFIRLTEEQQRKALMVRPHLGGMLMKYIMDKKATVETFNPAFIYSHEFYVLPDGKLSRRRGHRISKTAQVASFEPIHV